MAAFLFILLHLKLPLRQACGPSAFVEIAFGVIGLGAAILSIFYRIRFLEPAAERLRLNPEDARFAEKWRSAFIVTLVLCEAVACYGLLLRFLNAASSVCAVFYSVGILLVLALGPKLDLPLR